MNAPDDSLSPVSPAILRVAKRWLLLGVMALGMAGIFAAMVAGSKGNFFYTALVLHVDLSVLVWFLAIASMLFALVRGAGQPNMVDYAAFYSFVLGVVALATSGFMGATPFMSNYIPVVYHPLFFLGLALLLCGVTGAALNVFSAGQSASPEIFAIRLAVVILLISILCFVLSVRLLPHDFVGQAYYEYVFWAGGHVLQFMHTQLMMVCWMWLAAWAGLPRIIPRKALLAFYLVGPLTVVSAPFIYLVYSPASDEFRQLFTVLMRDSNGVAPAIMAVWLLYGLVTTKTPKKGLPLIVLLMSITLFMVGGFLGYLIAGSNVIVPAHYHGSIIGVTIAFTGAAYLMFDKLGWGDVAQSRLACIQPLIHGGGQLLWMLGMALLGSHSVPRKTPGSAETVNGLYSFLKHGGDGLTMIGGLLFVFIVLRAALRNKRSEP